MKHCLSPLALILCCSILATGQDTTVNKWKFSSQLHINARWQLLAHDSKIVMPDALKERRKALTQLPISFDSLTDNPMMHGATYLTLKTLTTHYNKIRLFADLYAEQRGVSYGIFEKGNRVIYLVSRLEAQDSLRLFSRKIALRGRVGQFLDEKQGEGLTIYNIDAGGLDLSVSSGKWKLSYAILGDLYGGIGLNIDDAQLITLVNEQEKFRFGFSWDIMKEPFGRLKNCYTLNAFARKTTAGAALYVQVGYRPFSYPYAEFQGNTMQKTAAVIGYETKRIDKRLELMYRAELRYYGWLFNVFFNDPGLRFREPATDFYQMYANTVGKYLYPLRKFETPFSQWAVFTEFQAFQLGAANLHGTLVYHLTEKFSLSSMCDFNYLRGKKRFVNTGTPERTINFLYPFFEAGLKYKVAPGFHCSASVGNKAMNLDLEYPTQYLLARPSVSLSMRGIF